MNKIYFIDNETEELYELSGKKRTELIKKYPNWHLFNIDANEQELIEVYEFFKINGKLLADRKNRNIFVGLTV